MTSLADNAQINRAASVRPDSPRDVAAAPVEFVVMRRLESSMSLYNMINGVNPVAFFILPMLGKHADEYPRFRDCFLSDEEHPEYDDYIHVYTRTGGGNREGYEAENDEMTAMPEYVTDFDDSYDCTYASWVFRVPERWKADFAKFKEGRIAEFSDAYKAEMKRVYPKLAEKFDEIFASA